MKDRIKRIRKDEHLTQRQFGERIGLRPNAISALESGQNRPSDQTVTMICREFHIREDWLRYGVEPMQEPDELADAVSTRNLHPATLAFVRAFEALPDEQRRLVLNAVLGIADSIREAITPATTTEDDAAVDAAYAERVRFCVRHGLACFEWHRRHGTRRR